MKKALVVTGQILGYMVAAVVVVLVFYCMTQLPPMSIPPTYMPFGFGF